jgi:predicted transcriptional regulator of viral defense system
MRQPRPHASTLGAATVFHRLPPTGVCRVSELEAHKSDTPPDVWIAQRAAEQDGVVSASQLAAAGLNRTAIKVRARNGRLHRVHVGVYAVGHPSLSLTGRFKAGTLACEPDGALGYRAGGAHWGFMEWDEDAYVIEITTPYSAPRRRAGLRIHRTRLLDPRDFTHHKGIPITTPARTLLDLAEVLPDKGLRRAVRRAQALNLAQVRQIADVLTRANGRAGAKRLAALIADGPAPTRSDLEDIVLDIVDGGGLRRPQINRRFGRVYPDLRWPEQRLTVECDGATWHEGRLAREDDAERQARLEADGERVLRVSWQQACSQPEQTLSRMIAAGAPLRAQ